MLIRTNMEDLRDTTHTRHYELYRQARLEKMGFSDVGPDNKPVNFQETYETKRSEHLDEMQAKEDQMRQMFVQRVKEKEAELKESEKQLQQRFDKMKREHGDEKRRVDEERRQLEEEVTEFHRRRAAHGTGSAHGTLTLGKKKK